MKTHHTSKALLSLLSGALLSVSAASAQTPPPDLGAVAKSAVPKQKMQELTSKLSMAEKLQLRSATKKVRNDPQMVAARQALKDAKTKEAKNQARSALRTLRHDLLLKADPALSGAAFKQIMDRLDAAPVGEPNALTQ